MSTYPYVKHGQVHLGFVASNRQNPSPWMFPSSVLRCPTLGWRCIRKKPQLQAINREQIAAWLQCVHEQAECFIEKETNSW